MNAPSVGGLAEQHDLVTDDQHAGLERIATDHRQRVQVGRDARVVFEPGEFGTNIVEVRLTDVPGLQRRRVVDDPVCDAAALPDGHHAEIDFVLIQCDAVETHVDPELELARIGLLGTGREHDDAEQPEHASAP
jgi:hypothetical protein